MSENTSEERNHLFRDYKIENFDDSDLQSRLYAEIYYEPNIESEPRTLDISKTFQFDNMVAELNIEPESIQQKPEDKQPLEFEAVRGKSSKVKKISREHCNQNTPLSNEDTVVELLCNDILRVQNSANDSISVEMQTNTAELSVEKMNPIIHECDNINNDNPGNFSVEKEKKHKENVTKKHKSNHTKNKHQESFLKNHTSLNDTIQSKCNVLSKSVKQGKFLDKILRKDKQASDSSDSEESIFEIPVPPKPKPPLINLQDSDEENNTNLINPESIHTHMQEIREDIVLNCTIVQRGAKSIDEIKQLSKSVNLNKNQGDISTADTNKTTTKQSSQNTSKENNANFEQELFVTPGIHSYTRMQKNIDKSNVQSNYNLNVGKNNTLDAKISCSNNDPAINRKRQSDNKIESLKEKRQCIVQQNNQNVERQSSSGERRSESRNQFKLMSDTPRNYNLPCGQENFDVGELQQAMSKDPRMWAIMEQDLMPSPPSKQRTRFWNVSCSNCHRDGHQRFDCPVPRRMPCCHICGGKGHVEFRCPQKKCLTCGKQQNTFRKTCEYCRVLYCSMCHSIGHESKQCPDLWRRYHQTTDMNNTPQNPGNVMKPPGLLHCCNCTKSGHDSSMCTEYRWSQHFQTPAAVTNYMDGPLYTSFSDPPLTDIPLSKTTSSRSLIPQSSANIQQVMEERSSTSIDTSSSSTKANEMPISQGVICDPEKKGNLKSPISKLFQPEEKQKKHKQDGINEKEFTTILFAYGKFPNKDNKDARVILRNLSLLKNDLSIYGKKTVTISLSKREINPVFLKTLCDKPIEFELKIGSTICQRQAIMVQVIAMKEYIELIYDLLLYWINLPDDEKDYGIDVTLPMNPTKMFNLLSSRIPQLRKMSFTSYNKHIKGLDDPRLIFNTIKHQKIQLEQHKGGKKTYSRLRKRLWRLQVKLLMIVNTEPEPNVHISAFYNAMQKLKIEKQNRTIEKLDIITYLKLTLLYNHLFVPHTPLTLFKTLRRIEKHAEMIAKNTNYSPQIPQELKNDGIGEQENFVSHLNVNSSLPSTTTCTLQNINSAENLSAINIQQNTSNEPLIERRDVDITSIINDAIVCNHNEKITTIIKYSEQDSHTIMPLDTKEFNYDTPILTPKEGIKEVQLLTSDLNIECNTSTGKRDINLANIEKVPKQASYGFFNLDEKIRTINQQAKEQRKNRKEMKHIYRNASRLIEEARALKLPYLRNAASELQRKISNQTIMQKHVNSMQKMIKEERRYRKNVSTFWKDLNE